MINLKTQLAPTADSGGTWSFSGFYHQNIPYSISTMRIDGTVVNVNLGDVIGSNDNPLVEFHSGFTGLYHFRYTVTDPTCGSVSTTYYVDTTKMITRTYGALENHNWIIYVVQTEGKSVHFTLDGYELFDGQFNSNVTSDMFITPQNINVVMINGIQVVTNIATWLNQVAQANNLCFAFEPTARAKGVNCGMQLLKITYPSWYNDWRFNFNDTAVTNDNIEAADKIVKDSNGVYQYSSGSTPPQYTVNPTGCNEQYHIEYSFGRASGFTDETIECGSDC